MLIFHNIMKVYMVYVFVVAWVTQWGIGQGDIYNW